jgi:hypothetical protein
MNNSFFFIIFLCWNIHFTINAQSPIDTEIIRRVKAINLPIKTTIVKPQKELDAYQKIFDSYAKNKDKSGVVAALIASQLYEKRYWEEAKCYYEKAYQFRKKKKDFLGQRWELKALIQIAQEQEDIKQLYTYYEQWFLLLKKNKSKYSLIQRTSKDIIPYEAEVLFYDLSPRYKYYTSDAEKVINKEKIRYVLPFLEHLLKHFPQDREALLIYFEESIQWILGDMIKEGLVEEAYRFANESIKVLGKYVDKKSQGRWTRIFATYFRKSDSKWRGVQTHEYEQLGINLMEQNYTTIYKKGKDKAPLIFAHRYIATRYLSIKSYKKAVQHLATAIKLARKYKLLSSIAKAEGGIQSIHDAIVRSGGYDNPALSEVKTWKEGYSLKGLSKEDIEEIDARLNWRP